MCAFLATFLLNLWVKSLKTLEFSLSEQCGGALKALSANRLLFFAVVADEERSVEASYTAKDLAVLEGLEAVRKRPGMYIGSTDSRGLMHCLWEIIDNSVDESLAGHCKKIDINLESDGSIEVHDDGRGIPVDKEPKTGLTGVEVVMTKLHAGGDRKSTRLNSSH